MKIIADPHLQTHTHTQTVDGRLPDVLTISAERTDYKEFQIYLHISAVTVNNTYKYHIIYITYSCV